MLAQVLLQVPVLAQVLVLVQVQVLAQVQVLVRVLVVVQVSEAGGRLVTWVVRCMCRCCEAGGYCSPGWTGGVARVRAQVIVRVQVLAQVQVLLQLLVQVQVVVRWGWGPCCHLGGQVVQL